MVPSSAIQLRILYALSCAPVTFDLEMRCQLITSFCNVAGILIRDAMVSALNPIVLSKHSLSAMGLVSLLPITKKLLLPLPYTHIRR